ncbi:Mu transposase C-terminal domain-containing protein [Iningainema tapete]|uniref:Mu transposase C-terminal domain-containing protein n=1 Tax=Iningainema tapete TaxID=2806730 RepID=UPI001EE384E0|nr:Mu transposase C-terminal domain-containing protein [Iningainema tapete]
MAVETLIPNLNVRIENAAPYRADWKGLVERYFRTIHGHVKPFLPGYIDTDFKLRGGRDYRLDSRVDLDQFTEIIIHLIRYHNNHHYLANYDREEMMITDLVNPIPIELWKWGIENRSGRLRTFPEDIVKLNLMPNNKATITARGIKFKGMYYSCDKALKEYWFEKARSNLLSKSDKSLDISYDPRKLNFIYVRSPDGRNFEKCFLLDHQERYSNKNIHDIEYLLAYEERLHQKSQGNELQACVDLIADIESVVSRSEKLAEVAVDDRVSNSQKVAGIRENRADEKAKRRLTEGFELAPTEIPNMKKVVQCEHAEGATPKELQPDYLELLKKKRQERKDEHRE